MTCCKSLGWTCQLRLELEGLEVDGAVVHAITSLGLVTNLLF